MDEEKKEFYNVIDSSYTRTAHIEFKEKQCPYDTFCGPPFKSKIEDAGHKEDRDFRHCTVLGNQGLLGHDVLQVTIHSDLDGDGSKKNWSDAVQRTEIKGCPSSDWSILGNSGDKLVYQWWFKLSENITPVEKYFHIFQLFAISKKHGCCDSKCSPGASDDIQKVTNPIFTFSIKKKSGKPCITTKKMGQMPEVILLPLEEAVGRWIQCTLWVTYSDKDDCTDGQGSVEFDWRDVNDNLLLEGNKSKFIRNGKFEMKDIYFFCPGCNTVRPKFGLYRKNGNVTPNEEEYIQMADLRIYKKI